jgi:hypothetical protein
MYDLAHSNCFPSHVLVHVFTSWKNVALNCLCKEDVSCTALVEVSLKNPLQSDHCEWKHSATTASFILQAFIDETTLYQLFPRQVDTTRT